MENNSHQLYTSILAPASTTKQIPIYSDSSSFRTTNPNNYSHDETTSSMADSGYTSSNFNLTPNLTPNVSTQLRHTTFGHDLATIEETDEQQPIKVTPTTQTQLKLLSFHLTTPKMEAVGPSAPTLAGNLFAEATNSSDLFDNISLTPPLQEAENDEPRTPTRSISSMENSQNAKSTPRKPKIGTKRKRCAFREKLYSDSAIPDSKRAHTEFQDIENVENNVSFDVAELEEFSPICKSVKSTANSKVLCDRGNSNLDLTIASSTPKHDNFRMNFYMEKAASVHKDVFPLRSGSPKKRTKLFRKFQSFSPSTLKEVQHQKAGGQVQRRYLFAERKQTATVTATEVGDKKPLVRQMAFVREVDEEEEAPIAYYDPEPRRHAEPVVAEEGPLDLCLPKTPEKMDISNVSLIQPSNVLSEIDNLLAKPIVGDETDFKLSVSDVQDPSFEICSGSAAVEKNKILYPQLPRTPPRNVEVTPSKVRLSALKTTPGRDSFYLGKTKSRLIRPTYEKFERFNILSRLNEFQQRSPIASIFKLLPDEDLENVHRVSRNWREILADDKGATKRRLQFFKDQIPKKENCEMVVRIKELGRSMKEKTGPTRRPFSTCNKDFSQSVSVELSDSSPPASPSKRKFKENQKVIRKLGLRTRVTTCPRCSKPSPITESISKLMKHKSRLRKAISVPNRSSPNARRNILQKTHQFQHYHTVSSDSPPSEEDDTSDDQGQRNLRRNLFGDDDCQPKGQLLKSHSCDSQAVFLTHSKSRQQVSLDDSLYSPSPGRDGSARKRRLRRSTRKSSGWKTTPKYEYAICSGQNCRFKFCVRCQCAYHPGELCPSELQPYSPGKEEEKRQQNRNVMCTKQSRQTLKRLCKLDK